MGMLTDTHDQTFFEFDSSQFLANIKGLQAEYMVECEKAMLNGGEIIANEARKNIRQNFREQPTGTLEASIDVQIGEVASDHVDVLIGTNMIYAKQREYGGFIKAKNKPFLVFRLADGTWIRTKQVYQAPKPYLRPAFDVMREKAMMYIAAHLKAAVEKSNYQGVTSAGEGYYGE